MYRGLTEWGDRYFHLADFRDYVDTQSRVAALYRQPENWARKAVLNVARTGWFSSDRTIREYADDIWGLKTVPVLMDTAEAGARKKRPAV